MVLEKHTSIILSLKVNTLMVVPPSVTWRFVFVEIKVTFWTLSKNSHMRINTLTSQFCSLIVTSKSTICSFDELDSDACKTRTFNLSLQDLSLFSSLLLPTSLPDKTLNSCSFLTLSFSISTIKDIIVSFAAASIDLLFF